MSISVIYAKNALKFFVIYLPTLFLYTAISDESRKTINIIVTHRCRKFALLCEQVSGSYL